MESFNLMQAKELVNYIIDTNLANAEIGIETRISAQLIGDSGLGKTSAVLQVAQEREIDFVKLNMSQIEEVGDLCGYPIKEHQIQSPEGKTKWVTSESLLPFFKKGWMPTDVKPRMSYAIPEWIAGRGEQGILLLDDYSRGDVRLLQATMELIDRGEYISWKLPKGWHVILTSNPDNGEFIVNTMDAAQKGRYLSMDIHYDKDVWARWAEDNNVDSRCINFMLMNEDVVRTVEDPATGSDPRNWTRFFYTIGHIGDFKSPEGLQRIEQIGRMAVGAEYAATFATYINGDMDKIPEAKQILFSKRINDALKKLDPIVNPNGQYQAQMGSVIGTRVVNLTSLVLEKKRPYREGFNKEMMMDNVVELVCSEILGKDMSFSFAQTLMERHPHVMSPLLGNSKMRKYLLG